MAFLFTLPYCYYRKCTSILWKYLKIPYILTFVFHFLYYIIVVATFSLTSPPFAMTINIILSLAQLGVAIFVLIRCIKCGQHFYEAYYEQYCNARTQNEDLAQAGGVSVKNMLLSCLVLFVIAFVIEMVSICIALLIYHPFSI